DRIPQDPVWTLLVDPDHFNVSTELWMRLDVCPNLPQLGQRRWHVTEARLEPALERRHLAIGREHPPLPAGIVWVEVVVATERLQARRELVVPGAVELVPRSGESRRLMRGLRMRSVCRGAPLGLARCSRSGGPMPVSNDVLAADHSRVVPGAVTCSFRLR